ncbi:MAG: hypothetical protein U0271_04180 [Polyangiaceae bacterium]
MTIDLAFATPRKLPKARDLKGRVVVVDIAFASESGGGSFETTTLPFIEALGARLAAWVDHHDSDHHPRFAGDPRFLLRTKAAHGACPELITPAVVEAAGHVDTLVCHNDFDGLASAAKWLRRGVECYPGCDADARAIDTRIGVCSPTGVRFDRAIRARPRDAGLFGIIVRHLAAGLADPSLWQPIDEAAGELAMMEQETRRLADGYVHLGGSGVVFVDATSHRGPYDKTLLLLLGQERARIAAVLDGDSFSLAAPFDSGLNFLALLGLSGGMPTRVSIPKKRAKAALLALGVKEPDARLVDASAENN